jgi:uncharacterized membrane protein
MNQKLSFLTGITAGIGAGAATMYLLDPDRGKRRRALIRDQAAHQAHLANAGLGKSERDLRHRVNGLLAIRHWLPANDTVSDDVLVARVRSKVGRITSHPGALEIAATNGTLQASGPILASEAEHVLACIRAVRGVKGVVNHLEVYDRPEDIPALQTGGTVPRILQHQEPLWSPALRLFAILGGGLLVLAGVVRRGIPGAIFGVLGTGLLVRGISNMGWRRLVGIGDSRPAIGLQRTLTIHAPLAQVFALWSHYETLPEMMQNLREVRRTEDNQLTWVATGLFGLPTRWQAVVTAFEPNLLIAWRTVPGSAVSQIGTLRFEAPTANTTRLDLRLSYSPPGGMLGHLVATLLGANFSHMIDKDLVRFKSLVEYGRTRAHGTEVTRDHLLAEIG